MGCCYRCAHRGVGEQQRQPQQLQAHAAQQAERLALAARREPLVEIAVQITVEIALNLDIPEVAAGRSVISLRAALLSLQL